MAVTKTILKNTNLETIIKVGGTSGTANITLATDCLAGSQELDGATQVANITGYMVSGLLTSAITVTRNAQPLMTFAPENSGVLDFQGQGFADTTNNTSDLAVTIGTAEAHIFIKIRKVSGYKPKVETATFGGGDNPAVAGA
jgi:hypothetical protein